MHYYSLVIFGIFLGSFSRYSFFLWFSVFPQRLYSPIQRHLYLMTIVPRKNELNKNTLDKSKNYQKQLKPKPKRSSREKSKLYKVTFSHIRNVYFTRIQRTKGEKFYLFILKRDYPC